MKKDYKVKVKIESWFIAEVAAENEREAIDKAEDITQVEFYSDDVVRNCLIQFGDSECELDE